MKNSRYNKIFFDKAFSVARMKPYFDRYPGDEARAVRHYEQNIRLAESLEPSLSVFEVTLRNAVIRELERMTGRKDGYESFKLTDRLSAEESFPQFAKGSKTAQKCISASQHYTIPSKQGIPQ